MYVASAPCHGFTSVNSLSSNFFHSLALSTKAAKVSLVVYLLLPFSVATVNQILQDQSLRFKTRRWVLTEPTCQNTKGPLGLK